jgi:hypothetical protein
LGFEIPRDEWLIKTWSALVEKHLENYVSVAENPKWFFPEQDILNILVKTNDFPLFSISHRQLELGYYPNKSFYNRKFPLVKQKSLFPKDQLKYLIHGAALKRPWLNSSGSKLKNKAYQLGLKVILKKPTPYERAWAYYTCSENLPIPLSSWSKQHNFTACKNFLWRKAHDL